MAWKIIGILEGTRGGSSVLPPEFIGTPNDFHDTITAQRACEAMNAGLSKSDQSKLRYTVVPAIDDGLHAALRGEAPQQAPAQPPPLAGWNQPTKPPV